MLSNEEIVSRTFTRYPSTLHLEGSRLQTGDSSDCRRLKDLEGRHVVIEEKLDGAQAGFSFTEGGEMLAQSRGHYLLDSQRQFGRMFEWLRAMEGDLLERLEDRYLVFGENCFAKHSCFYDRLPALFNEFDIWDRKDEVFLDTARRRALLAGLPVVSVPVLYAGPMPTDARLIQSLVRPSLAKSADWRTSFEAQVAQQKLPLDLCWQQTDKSDMSEGLYLKVEEGGVVVERYKFVRHSFTQTILESGSHHSRRPVIPNQLVPGATWLEPARWEDLGLKTLNGLDELKAFAGK